jgi:hypothetical protein
MMLLVLQLSLRWALNTMIDDLLKSAKETIAERLSSPLLGGFAAAWCLWNYKFIVILFSAAGVSQTFNLIETVAFPDSRTLVTRGMLYPLLSALLYVFAYPYPARFVYAFTQKRQREVNQIKRQIEGETLLTLEQSRTMRAEYVQLEHKNQEVVDNLNAEVSRLKVALDQARKESPNGPANSPAESLYGQLAPTQLALLKLLEKRGVKMTEEELIVESTEPKVKATFDLGELQNKRLISRSYDDHRRAYTYDFTHEGRRALLDGGRLGT